MVLTVIPGIRNVAMWRFGTLLRYLCKARCHTENLESVNGQVSFGKCPNNVACNWWQSAYSEEHFSRRCRGSFHLQVPNTKRHIKTKPKQQMATEHYDDACIVGVPLRNKQRREDAPHLCSHMQLCQKRINAVSHFFTVPWCIGFLIDCCMIPGGLPELMHSHAKSLWP